MAFARPDTSVRTVSLDTVTTSLAADDTSLKVGPMTVRAGEPRFRLEWQGDSVATVVGIDGTVVARNSADPADSLVVHPGERVLVRKGQRPVRLPR